MTPTTKPQAAAERPGKAFQAAPANYTPDYSSIANAVAFLLRNGARPEWTSDRPAQPAPRIDIEPAIMDEDKLPRPPEALIEGLLSESGKMTLTGASKTWKSFLMVQLGLGVAMGTDWLGLRCRPGKVLYVNLEINKAQFMRRVFDVARALGADSGAVERGFFVAHGIDAALPIDRLVDAILSHEEARGCALVIVDPIYKAFAGSENDQRDMAAFCGQLDRLVSALGCAVATVHHQSKGYQGKKDIADRAAGSGVLGRDVDALVDVCRLQAPGNAMRATFLLRGYDELAPIEYTFEHPLCIRDTSGNLARARFSNAHEGDSRAAKGEATLARIEAACEELLEGRDEIDRKEVADLLNMKGTTVSKYLGKSSRFTYETGNSWCRIKRCR